MKKIIYILIIILILLSIIFLFNYDNKENENKLNIVTSFYPIYIMTSNIVDGMEDVRLVNLTNSEIGCLHDYQLTTENMITLEMADAFIINGIGMEGFLDKVIDSYSDLKVIDSSDGIEFDENNSHIWVSISNNIKQVENIRDELIKIDSRNEEVYRRNADNYIAKLESLKIKIHNELDNIENKKAVTYHDSFKYFADEFNIEIIAEIQGDHEELPSAGHVVEIINKINEVSVKAIFIEPQYVSTVADTISRETGVPVYNLDPAVTGRLDKDSYIEIMEENLESLKEAFKE